MTKEEYIGSITTLNNIKVDVSIDDYGQQCFIEFEKDGELKEYGMGSYNVWFMNDLLYLVDKENYLNGEYVEEYIDFLYKQLSLLR